jgi:hypothetical protein
MRTLALATLLLAAAPAPAQSTVQHALSGAIDRSGGARAEVEVTIAGVGTGHEPRTIAFGMLLAEHTSAADVAALLEKRLTAGGAAVTHTGSGQAARRVTCLFVEDVLAVAVRLGDGLSAALVLCEDRPYSVRLLPPETARSDAALLVVASTWHPHERTRKRTPLEVSLKSDLSQERCADLIATASIRSGWVGEVEHHRTWKPADTIGSGTVEAVSFELETSGDWRLEVGLPPRRRER